MRKGHRTVRMETAGFHRVVREEAMPNLLSLSLVAFSVLSVGACAFVPRNVNISAIEGRVVYPREAFTAVHHVAFGPFEDRRPSQTRLGVGRNKLMMVTTSVGIEGDLRALLERVVRQNFAASGIGEGRSPITVKGAVLEATTDAVGPDHVYVQVTASLTILDSTSNVPILHRTLTGRTVTPVTQISNMAWEDAFVGALNQISGEVQQIAAVTATSAVAAPVAPTPGADDRAVASGFVLRDTNLVLTNYHVVRDRRHITLRFPSGESYSGRVISVDSGRDLALIEVLGRPASAGGLVLAPGEIKIGETVHAIGYPLGDTLSRQPSLVSGQVSSTVGLRDDIAQFRTTAPINPGNSGGPILNQNGQVVGIAAAGIVRTGVEGIRFGIKASAAQLMLRQAVTGSAFDITAAAAGPMPVDKIFEQSAPHVVLIETR